MFYVIVDYETPSDSFFISDDDGYPLQCQTEDEAIAASKEYNGPKLILRGVAVVTEKTTYKVEKLK
jgi:hypothetical protein